MANIAHRSFGGGWSDEKLLALRRYLSSYTTALKNTPFELVFIDAFAGAGTREIVQAKEDRLLIEPLETEEANYRHGSPLIALGSEPPFHRFIFIERDAESIAKLHEEVAMSFPEKLDRVTFKQGDANEALQALAREPWRSRRAVAFLDPFALHVSWRTLEAIAQTEAIDMWLLFPAMAVNRMLPRSGIVPEAWAEKLTEVFGTEEWRNQFLRSEDDHDLFGETRTAKIPQIFESLSDFITLRLQSIFPGVHKKPLVLRNSVGAPLFLLCFACGSRKGSSIALRIAGHIINKKRHGH